MDRLCFLLPLPRAGEGWGEGRFPPKAHTTAMR